MYNDIRHNSSVIIHPSHAKMGITPFPDKLWVITPIVNSQRYVKRYELYRAFEKRMKDSGVILTTIELAFGDREFEITEANNPRNIQVRTSHEMWYKENLINLAIQRLPPEAKYIAWIDADLSFTRPDWAQETLQQLQHYDFVQLFSDIVYVSNDSEIVSSGTGFMAGWRKGTPIGSKKGTVQDQTFGNKKPVLPGYYGAMMAGGKLSWPGSPGGAWAARRKSVDAVGGLIDYAILGAADHYMATGLLGHTHLVIKTEGCSEYVNKLLNWQNMAQEYIKNNVGFVKGVVTHHWHGNRVNRQYGTRGGILTKHHFNPDQDLKRDSQGLWQLTDKKWQLRDDIRAYFCSRNEDSIE